MDRSTWILILGGMYVALELVSNITAGRLVAIGGLVLPGATFLYSLTFTVRDAFHLAAGYRMAKVLVGVGLAANGLLAGYSALVRSLPAPPFFSPEAHDAVFGQAGRVVAASLTAYLVSTAADTALFERLRRRPGLGVLVSNLLSVTLDTATFIALAFAGSGAPLLEMAAGQGAAKLVLSLAALPLVYAVRASLRQAA